MRRPNPSGASAPMNQDGYVSSTSIRVEAKGGLRAPDEAESSISAGLLFVLGLAAAFGPLTMDFYLPGLPRLAADLGAAPGMQQLTVSVCLVGLAAGQIISGPLSDRYGRRKPLLAGLALFAVASIGCAIAPTIDVLLVGRLLQGVGGAAGIVGARAIVADLYAGPRMAAAFARLNVVTAMVPVIAPLVGGAIVLFAEWRWVFIILAAIGAGLFIACLFVVPESLPAEQRNRREAASQIRAFRYVLRDGPFVLLALMLGVGNCALHAYISLGVLVLQGEWGLDAQQFAAVYAANAAGMVIGSQSNVFLLRWFSPSAILSTGLVITAMSGAALVALLAADASLLLVLLPVFVTVTSQGFVLPNATALALGRMPRHTGSAAAVLGVSQFLLGAVIPPLVSLLGRNGAVMGSTILGCAAVALLLLVAAGRLTYWSRRDA